MSEAHAETCIAGARHASVRLAWRVRPAPRRTGAGVTARGRRSSGRRERGFNAHAGPAGGGDVNYIPVAIDASLGVAGKNGLLMTRNNGPRVRLAAVYTDIENLPFSQDNPHSWIRDYCEACNLCVEKCPVDAIYMETKTLADGGPAFIDHAVCADPFSNDNGCTLCIKYCPFSYGDYDMLKKKFESSH